MTKYEYMELALKLAKKGLGRTSPNPAPHLTYLRQQH